MKTKKFLSLVLALVMALSLAIPAFAADVEADDAFEYDASGLHLTSSGGNTTFDTLTIGSTATTLSTSLAGDETATSDITAAMVAEWATGSDVATDFAGWAVTTNGLKVIFTATTATDDTAIASLSPAVTAATTRVNGLDGLGTGGTTDIDSSTNVPTINVIIPKSGSAILNPYKMAVSVNGSDNNNQIISAMQYVKSTSNVPLKVNVKAVAAPSDAAITMATKTVTDKVTDKQVYMYLNTASVASTATAPTEATVTFPAYNKATAAILATGDGGTLTGVELGAAKDNEASYLAFRLEGDMTPAPTTAWAATDTVGVTLTFTFVASAITTTTP